MNKNKTIKIFLVCLLICLGGGWITGLLTQHGVKNWYPLLVKPKGTPPDIVFPIVWTILYICMAISLTALWISEASKKKLALTFFAVQLCLNFIWSWLFFYIQRPGIALLDLTLLWIFVGLTIVTMRACSRFGSNLLLPYLCWITYAFYLNLFIWLYN